MWIGSESTVDKKAIAAIRAVELNAYVENKGVQHREEENQESELFLGYFPEGIATKEGGTDSNFRDYEKVPITVSHITKFDMARLYCVQWYSRESHSINMTLVCGMKLIVQLNL